MMRRPPQSPSQDTLSSEVARARARARARKVRRCISRVRMGYAACVDKDVQVEYAPVLVSFALAHKTHRQQMYVDKLHKGST